MIKFVWGKSFDRAYRKRISNNPILRRKFKRSILLFEEDPFHPSLQTHKLSGKLKGLHAFTIDYDCRVVFQFLSQDKVLLIDIGSHDEVY